MLGALTLLTLASFEAVTPLPLAAQMWENVADRRGQAVRDCGCKACSGRE